MARVRQTRNREFAAREPLSRGTKSRDDRGRNRHAFHLDRIIRIAPGPHPRLAAFDRKRAADRDVMRHLEARAPELADLGGDVRHVVELGGPVKASLALTSGIPTIPKAVASSFGFTLSAASNSCHALQSKYSKKRRLNTMPAGSQ